MTDQLRDKHSAPTPRTDAVAIPKNGDASDWVSADFARQLERELAAARGALAVAVAHAEDSAALLESARSSARGEPVAWLWQHPETGMTGFISHCSEAARAHWERMNKPRQIVRPVHDHAAPSSIGEPVAQVMRAAASDGRSEPVVWLRSPLEFPDGATLYIGAAPSATKPSDREAASLPARRCAMSTGTGTAP